MKISQIELRQFLHFKKNLKIDLTYPKGHSKAGQPLDKICFLGQSGTGKTTLLNLIKYFSCEDGEYDKSCIPFEKFKNESVIIHFKAGALPFSKVASSKDFKFTYYDYSRTPKQKITDKDTYLKKAIEPQLANRTHLLLNFPFCVVTPDDIPSEKFGGQEKGIVKFNISKGELSNPKDKLIWDFNSKNIKEIWDVVFSKVSVYIKEYNTAEIELSRKVRDKPNNAVKFAKGFVDWEKKKINPIRELSDKFLNPILNQFSLEVETDIKKYSTEYSTNENYIIVKAKNNGEQVQYPFLSTGTKQILLTAIPLYFLKPQKSIILFDQPETSLYPNIQLKLVDIYLDIASNTNQFFFATHSPLVASSFDPWEVVELRFDDSTGEVYRKEYFEGNREKKNYNINPKLLRWDSSYKILFDTNVEGNSERENELMNLATMESRIKQMKKSGPAKNKLAEEYRNLAKKLDWNI